MTEGGAAPTAAKTERVYVKIMGRRMLVNATADDAAEMRKGKRRFSAIKSRSRERALDLIRRGDNIAASIEAVCRCSQIESSEARLPVILSLLAGAPATVVWPVFLSEWSRCDDTWLLMPQLLTLLRRNAPGWAYLDDYQRAVLDGLPGLITVYRGCSLERVHGLSWTLSRKVAAKFARGHRGISIRRPTIARARMRRVDVFAVFVDRKEDEVILDPDRLRSVVSDSAPWGE
jgi:hypothetical protein